MSNQEMIDFINKHWDGSTDNNGQIIIYTSMMEDDDGNIVPWVDRFDREYCDACGEVLTGARVPFSSLPIDVASANAGESAVLCPHCHVIMIQKMEEEDPTR